MSKRYTLHSLIICLLVLISCQKQKSPELTIDYGRDDIKRVEACRKVSFLNDLLLKNNTIELFKCLNWDTEFPDLYKNIARTSSENWDHLMGPINSSILNNRDIRDQLIALVKDLDKKGALDDLGNVITALNDTNFFDSLNELFVCASDDPVGCSEGRAKNKLTKEQIKNLFNVLTVEKDTIDAAYETLVYAVGNFIPVANEFKMEVRKFYKNEIFKQQRADLITVATSILLNNPSIEKDRQFIEMLLNEKENDGSFKIVNLIRSGAFSLESFKNMFHFPLNESLELDKDFKVVKKIKEDNLICQSNSGNLVMDLGTNLERTLKKQVEGTTEDFFRDLLDLGLEIKTAGTFCNDFVELSKKITIREVSNNEVHSRQVDHTLKLLKFMKDYGKYLNDDGTFDVMKFLISVALKNENIGSLYLIDIAAGDSVSVLLRMGNLIQGVNADIDKYIFPIIKNLGPREVNNFSLLANKFFKQKEVLIDFARLWQFYNFQEKNYLFHYIDKHFEEDVNYPALLKFYLDTFSITKDMYPAISDSWVGSDVKKERTYKAVSEMVSNMSGKDTLRDFKKMFSREYVLRIIEVLSRGVKDQGNVLAILNYNQNGSIYYANEITLSARISTFTANKENQFLSCLLEIEKSKTFWTYLKGMPATCQTLQNPPAMSATFGLISEINEQYVKSENRSIEHFLTDSDGFLNKDIVNSQVVLFEHIDNILKDKENGITELMTTLKKYLYNFEFSSEKRLNKVLENGLPKFINLMEVDDQFSKLARTKFTKYLISMHKDGYLTTFIQSLSEILVSYSKSNLRPSSSPGIYNFPCRKELNQNLDIEPCPNHKMVAEGVTKTMGYFLKKQSESTETALVLLLKALIPQEGLSIPYEGKKLKKYNLGLKETLKVMYDFNDKELLKDGKEINRLPVVFKERDKSDNENKIPKIFTTAERIETVIREIRFDNNYLGAHYLNAVAKAEDYNFTVSQKYDLLKFCVGLGFCGKFFSKDEKRMAQNSIATYPSLLDANAKFGYGDWMQTLLQVVVASSDPAAQKSAIVKVGNFEVPMLQTKDQLLRHNGQIIIELSMLYLFSNGGRYFKDRIGLTTDLKVNRDNFYKFLSEKKINAISKAFMDDVKLNNANISFEKIIKSGIDKKIQNGSNLVDLISAWFGNLNDEELPKVERVLSKLLYITAFMGPPSKVAQRFSIENQINRASSKYAKMNDRYLGNNLNDLIYFLGEMAEFWPNFYNASGNSSLKEMLIENEDMLDFCIAGLESGLTNLLDNKYYFVLNELQKIFNYTVSFEGVNISRLLKKSINIASLSSEIFQFSRDLYNFLTKIRIGEEGKIRIGQIGRFFDNLIRVKNFSIDTFVEYLSNVSSEQYVQDQTNTIVINFHYDEPYKVMKFISKEDSKYLKKLLNHLFFEYFDNLSNTLKEMFSSLSVVK